MTSLLEARDLRIQVQTPHGPHLAVRGVDLELKEGETLSLVGESGSGKSLSALSLVDLLPEGVELKRGSIRFDGEDLRAKTPRQRRALLGQEIGLVFQDPLNSLNPFLPVGQQILEVARRRGLRGAKGREEVLRLLAEVEIPDPEGSALRHPHQLSGGQCQRVMIAMALAGNPRLLIADEPTTALDVSVQRTILDLFARLREERKLALLLITHDFSVVARLGGRIAVLYAGRVVESLAMGQLAQARHPYTRALLKAVPRLHGSKELVPIPGQPPRTAQEFPGCAFAPRCPEAFERCSQDDPQLASTTLGQVACFAREAGGEAAP